jgi:hypothetical protein
VDILRWAVAGKKGLKKRFWSDDESRPNRPERAYMDVFVTVL